MVKIVKWNSEEYWAGIALRNKLLKATAGKEMIQTIPIEEKNDIHVVALDEDQVIGTLIISKVDQQSAQIKQVAVNDAYQGEGVGKKMLIFAEEVVRITRFKKVFLLGRSQAWGFYVRAGYQEFGQAYYDGKVLLKGFEKELTQNTRVKTRTIIHV
ncbi:GNAT family N-acetyltransferase [Enterococcus sp. LJL99]